MNRPTEAINRLSKTMQQYIQDLERDVALSKSRLNNYLDSQTPSQIFVVDNDNVNYIQSHRVSIVRGGVQLDVLLPESRKGIELAWGNAREHQIYGDEEIAFIPTGRQNAKLVSRKDMS